MLEGRHCAALDCLLTVLSVYPNSTDALQMAGSLVYLSTQAEVSEPLTMNHIRDPRLDQLFCSCQEPGCSSSWVSARRFITGDVTVLNPRGGRCERCSGYFCRNHFAPQAVLRAQCPRCGGAMDPAPRVSNGRPPLQTVRLNQPLIHVHVMREGPGRIGPDYMTRLLQAMAPDAFEDSPTIRGIGVPSWPDDCKGLAMAQVAVDHPEYLTETYDMLIFDGGDEAGTRWVLVKVFATMPKYIDPDFSSDSGKTEPELAKVSPWRSLWRRRK